MSGGIRTGFRRSDTLSGFGSGLILRHLGWLQGSVVAVRRSGRRPSSIARPVTFRLSGCCRLCRWASAIQIGQRVLAVHSHLFKRHSAHSHYTIAVGTTHLSLLGRYFPWRVSVGSPLAHPDRLQVIPHSLIELAVEERRRAERSIVIHHGNLLVEVKTRQQGQGARAGTICYIESPLPASRYNGLLE